MLNYKYKIALIVLTALAFLGLLELFLTIREKFETASAAACFSCTTFFPDALNVKVDDLTITRDETAIRADIATRVGNYASARAKVISNVLDAATKFIAERQAGTICTDITEVGAQYFTCMNKYVTSNVSCGTTGCLEILDIVMKKAMICSSKDCDDEKLFPRANEQAQCRATSVCKTVEELEENIKNQIVIVKGKLDDCAKMLTSTDSECNATHVTAILTKMKAKIAIELSDAEKARGPQLGSAYGQTDVLFDLNSMVYSNTLI
jgi:hypothetical protein